LRLGHFATGAFLSLEGFCHFFSLFFLVGREMGRRWKALDAAERQHYKDEYSRLRGDQQNEKQVLGACKNYLSSPKKRDWTKWKVTIFE
jgi:hypothetical protein